MTACKMRVKAWFLDKEQQKAKHYNTWIDCVDRTTDEHGMLAADADGCYTVIAEEVLAESDKAAKVKLSTGLIVGSVKGWTTWIPKSLIIETK